jgi:hypothetical protein
MRRNKMATDDFGQPITDDEVKLNPLLSDPPIIITGSGGHKSLIFGKKRQANARVESVEVHIKYKDTEKKPKKRTPFHDREKGIRAVRVEVFDREIELDDDIISANPIILPLPSEFSIRLTLLAPSRRRR